MQQTKLADGHRPPIVSYLVHVLSISTSWVNRANSTVIQMKG